MNYDLIIIGAGPAALTASIYASRYKINHIIVGELPGGLMSEAHKICNFPSEIEISGFDLTMKMKAHVDSFGTEFVMDKATSIEKASDGFMVKTAGNKEFSAPTILLAAGTVHRHLGLSEESRFVGHGLSYCATCDAMFYKDKTAAVIGAGNSAMTAALYLAEVANKVYIVARGSELRGEVVWMDQVKNNPKIEVIGNTSVVGLAGENKLETIKLSQPYNGNDILAVDGLFVEIGSAPDTAWLGNLELKAEASGYLIVQPDHSTSQPGIWAAGDITNGSNGLRQVVTACAEGAIAAGAIFKHLQQKK